MVKDRNRPVIIYISAAPALAAEREALARMIAELPVTLIWRIVQTPSGDEQLKLEALLEADLHFLVMEADIQAPVGLEWMTAHRAGRRVYAFLKQGGSHTPAGQVFIRQTEVIWQPYTDAANLSHQVQRLLIEHLVRQAIDYSLTPTELQQLEALQSAGSKSEEAVKAEGAGRSAVILSPERYRPNEGVVVDE